MAPARVTPTIVKSIPAPAANAHVASLAEYARAENDFASGAYGGRADLTAYFSCLSARASIFLTRAGPPPEFMVDEKSDRQVASWLIELL